MPEPTRVVTARVDLAAGAALDAAAVRLADLRRTDPAAFAALFTARGLQAPPPHARIGPGTVIRLVANAEQADRLAAELAAELDASGLKLAPADPPQADNAPGPLDRAEGGPG